MNGKGETVKYYIDADTSGFARGMGEAALESDVAGRKIESNLNRTSKRTENNFKDIRRNAQTAAASIRNFGVAFQAFNTTSLIIGVTALAGAALELAGAFAAAGSTVSVLAPLLIQGGAAALTFKTGVSGLSDAFKAIQKQDPVAFRASLVGLGPAATQVAYAFAGLNKAFNSVKLNTQQALLNGVGQSLLTLGAQILPTVNAGFQTIGQAMNRAFKQAANLAGQPIFSGLLATIFADTAHTIDILSGAIAPLLSLFTNLYLITRPYVSLLAQATVNLLSNAAAYLNTVKGQESLNLAIQVGILAIQSLARLTGAVFGFLSSVFRASALSGDSIITTLTGIVHAMTAWVNSAKGQAQLQALFQFTSLTIQAVASSIGRSLSLFFDLVQIVSTLNPVIQQLIVGFLASALTLRPVLSYLSQLYLALRVLAVTLFNVVEQGIVLFAALGAVASVVVILAAALIIIGAIIRGPLGTAFIIVGAVIAAYIGLNYLLAGAARAGAASFWEQGTAALIAADMELELAGIQGVLASTMIAVAGAAEEAGVGLGFAASAAEFLQAALIPLLVLAAGVLIILSMLGVFSSKGKQAQGASIGLGSSLGALQKSMSGVGATGAKAGAGLSPLSDSLNNVGAAAAAAQGSLASFDKMNVLTPNLGGPGSGIPGVPSLPNIGSGGMGAPALDTGAFDKSLADMQKNFDGLKTDIGKGFTNPFDGIGKWIEAHPWDALLIFAAIVLVVAAAFIVLAVGVGAVTLASAPLWLILGLIVLAVIAIIAIIILLVQNWSTVWATIQNVAGVVWAYIQGVWKGILDGAQSMITAVGNFFTGLWNGIVAVFSVAVAFFTGIFSAIGAAVMFYVNIYINAFKAAWTTIQVVWGVVVAWFGGVWNGIMGIFGGVGSWFGNVFNGAWNAIKSAFGSVVSFFQGIWNSIVNIFGSVGTSVGNAIGGAVKSVVNTVINAVSGIINTVIDLINGALGLINKLPGGIHIGTIGRLNLPHLAKGALITSPTVAEIGENGTEAVMPLENNTGWIDQLAAKINSANGSGNGQPIQLTVQIGEDKIATKVINLINEKTQMSGRNTILV